MKLLLLLLASPVMAQDTIRIPAGDTLRTITVIVGKPAVPPPVIPPPPPVVPPPVPVPTGFVTPDLLNNASFETNFEQAGTSYGFTSWSRQAPTGVNRVTDRAYRGTTSVRKVLPVTTGGGDVGSQFMYWLAWNNRPPADRLWTRFYFYLDRAITGGIKFSRYFDTSGNLQFSGLGIFQGHITFRMSPEVDDRSPTDVMLVPLSQIVGGWHSIEVDYWRNGDPTGNPSAAFWLDGVAITRQASGNLAPGFQWIGGRLNAGRRASSAKFGGVELIGLINGPPLANTVAANIWVDVVSVSSVGRIGP